MNKIFAFVFYLFLILFFLVLLGGIAYWTLFIKGWPWWILGVIVASCLGVFLGYRAVKKLLIRRNEKKFVQQVIQEEASQAQQQTDQGVFSSTDMERQWKESVEKLKKSHLRRFGNPLYVLPWYIMIGESRSGKTSAIKHSNLNSTLTDVSSATIVSGTKNCDWWFLDQAIILDTAGRYTIPIEEETDKKEWQTFLTLLSKYRKKEPVNGVIVTVASDSLLTEDTVVLREKANSIRQRINQMMRIMGARFPVYLLVTKMDLVNGFTDFCDHISEQRYSQVMGYFNESGDKDCTRVLENCMASIYDQIRQLRSHIVHNRINHFAILFSSEFMSLRPGLEAYVQSLFSDDIYQATPLFRGIYFSSACRKGVPESEFLKTTGITYNHDTTLDRNKSFFLKNFFGAVLPKDRNVFTPLSEFLMWQRTTISLTVFSLMLILLSMSGVLTFSYVNNMKALTNFDASFFQSVQKTAFSTDTILILDRQRYEIDKLTTNNNNWILPRMGLDQSRALEKKLKNQYVKDVSQYLIAPLDDLFADRISVLNSQTPYGETVDYAVYTVKRINLLKNSLENRTFSDQKEFEKSIQNLFSLLDKSISPAIAAKFSLIYHHYLTWNENKIRKQEKLETYQELLAKIAVRTDNFNWIVSDRVSTAADILVENFVKGFTTNQSILSPKAFISGAFTKTGRNEIQQFIKMIENAFSDSDAFQKFETDFWAWYTREFYSQWFDFSSVFPVAETWKSLVDNWADLGTLMAGDQNPYFLLLAKMADEIEWMKDQPHDIPLWAEAVVRLKKVQSLAETEIKKEKGSWTARLSITKEKLTDKMQKVRENETYKPIDLNQTADLEYNLKFAEIWNEYVTSLQTLSTATAYNEKCFHMFSDYFKALSDPEKQKEPYSLTYDNLVNLKAFLKQNQTSPVVLNLITGPFDFMGIYGIHNSVAYLQKKWEEMVLGAASGIDPDNYYAIMFDRTSGIIWKFVNEEAAPFIEQSRIGFLSKKAFGLTLPFNNAFFTLLTKGEKLSLEHQDEYAVTIQTAPIEMNKEAVIRPHSSSLVLECADKKTELINNNFLETEKFIWKPATCGDVTLEVVFQDMAVEKSYAGKLGFAKFLSDFSDGSKRFDVTDFPAATGYLTNNNVTDINVSFQIQGIEPVLHFLNRRPPEIPDVIFTTMQQKSGTYPLKKQQMPEPDSTEPKMDMSGLKDSYRVTLDAVPMGTNAEASVKPVSGIFWMDCQDQVVRFENNNYPNSVDFDWKPDTCGKVILIIHFPQLAVVKEYKGFLEFAADFGYKSKTFTVDDYPQQKDALLKLGITEITIAYEFKGDLPLVENRNLKPSASGIMNKPADQGISNGANQIGTGSPEPAEALPGFQDLGTKEWILLQDTDRYTIHVLLGPSRDKVISFAQKNNLDEAGAVYKSIINGQEQYNLIYGSFGSHSEAGRALAQLPETATTNSPWIRKFAAIIKEIE
jgi:type VI secretion system protein ImpL